MGLKNKRLFLVTLTVAVVILMLNSYLYLLSNAQNSDQSDWEAKLETLDLDKPKHIIFILDDEDELDQKKIIADLDNQTISAEELKAEFQESGFLLVGPLVVSVKEVGKSWLLADSATHQIYLVEFDDNLNDLQILIINEAFPNFPNLLTPQIPHDVDKSFKEALSLDDPYQFAEAQRLHDIFSWQSFLAINWPVDDNENPKPDISDATGIPRWATWINSHDVFKLDGSEPEWKEEKQLERFLTSYQKGNFITDPNLSAHIDVNQPDDVEEAFSSPLWDQNGNPVHYEIIMNRVGFDYIDKNQLYNRDGQIKFYEANQDHRFVVNFPWGNSQKEDSTGTIMLKLAWKIIDEEQGDIPDRYYVQNATVLTPDPADSSRVITVTGKVGLVGMHIAHRTFSSGEWIWSTFEHVDNLQVNNLELVEFQGEQRTLKPSFYDPDCQTCPVNVPPAPDENGVKKTQVIRVIPIPEATAELNQQVRQLLKDAGSVWQYYELIGTQWSTQSNTDPDTTDPLGSLTNESGGHPTPVYLTNSVMETYFQKGNQPIKDLTQHNQNDTATVFGTASCVGCHSNARIAAGEVITNGVRSPLPGKPISAEFNWSLWTKANWASTK